MGSWMCKFQFQGSIPSFRCNSEFPLPLPREISSQGGILGSASRLPWDVPGCPWGCPLTQLRVLGRPCQVSPFPRGFGAGNAGSPGGAACALGSRPRGKGAFSAFFCVLTPTNPCTKGSPCLQAGTSRGILLLWVGLELSELKFLLEEPESPCQSQSSLEIPLQMEFGGF